MAPRLENLAVIALGSNLGDSFEILRRAMERLGSLSDEPILKSSFWKSKPLDCPPGSPDFLNAVVAAVPRAGETPENFLGELQRIEREFGRKPKTVLNEPRPLDLDLITFQLERRQSSDLVLPHPRAHERPFVLAPMAEIGPDWILPGQTETVEAILNHLPLHSAPEKASNR